MSKRIWVLLLATAIGILSSLAIAFKFVSFEGVVLGALSYLIAQKTLDHETP